MWTLTEDTTEVALLCAWFAGEHHPLALHEYNAIASWLKHQELRPANLIDPSCLEEASQSTGLDLDRLTGLQNRRISMGFYLEEWKRRGIWMIGRGDEDYPVRIRTQLRSKAPPILYGIGEISLLNSGGTAMIGPSPPASEYSESLSGMVRLCAEHQSTIITAGKLSPATDAIEISIQCGGTFIWLLQGSLLAEPLSKPFRDTKASGKIVLLSTRSPADPRFVSGEPELGQLIITLCDSIIHIDGTELSMDWLHTTEIIHQAIPKKKCFIWTGHFATSVAEHLIQCGAIPWSTHEDAVHAGIFERLEDLPPSDSKSSPEELVDSEKPSYIDKGNDSAEENPDHAEMDLPSPDTKDELPVTDEPSEFLKESSWGNSVQGELFA
ncbi:MAG: hypothetical protein OXF06_06465 [Bacteroidetes bacterium]|nr:hypothetical protein [Bacteroidota bacterium]